MKTKPYATKLELLADLQAKLEAFREAFARLERHEARLPAGDPTELSGILVALDELEAQVDKKKIGKSDVGGANPPPPW